MRRIKRKKFSFNKKYLFILLGIVIIIIIAFIIFILLNNKQVKEKNLIYDNFEPVISRVDDNTYYMFGVKNDIEYEINKSDDFSFDVTDIEGNKINVNSVDKDGIVTIKAPNDLFVEGNTYKLRINNGTFKDDKLKDAKEVVFSVKRAASQTSILKDGVKSFKESDVTIDKKILKVNSDLKENDIVTIVDGNNIKSIYKIGKKNDDGYDISIPKLDEVFLEFDYYGMEKLNLSSFDMNKDIKTYLMGVIKRSLINTVYADKNIKIEGPNWNKKENKLEYIVKIDASDKSKLFDNDFLNYHKSKIEFAVSISVDLYRNISFSDYDVSLIVNMDINPLVELDNVNNKFNELYKAFNDNNTEYDATEVVEEYDKINSDKAEFDRVIGDVLLNTKVPGLYVNFSFETIFNMNGKANLKTNLNNNINFIAGIKDNLGIYGSFNFNTDGKITSFGDIDSKIGNLTKIDVNFMNINKLNLNFINNLEASSKTNSDINSKSDNEKIITVDGSGILKVTNRFDIKANIYEKELSKTVFDNSKEISKDEKKIEFVKKIDKKEELDNKYTADEIRKMLKMSYDELDGKNAFNEFMDTITVKYTKKMTIDIDNNELISSYEYDNGKATYTCTYNYLFDKINCNNYNDALNYVKGKCDSFYQDYLNFEQTGECENEDAEEWEFLYGSLDACYYEVISKEEPTSYKSEFEKILEGANLSQDDLSVLK